MTGWFVDDAAPVAVGLGECLCPGSPHADGDSVLLRAYLDLSTGMSVIAEIAQTDGVGAIERLGRAYLRAGIVGWTFVDGDGAPVPVTPQAIDRLRWSAGTYQLADRAAELYGEALLSPLAQRVAASSPNGQSAGSTSATHES